MMKRGIDLSWVVAKPVECFFFNERRMNKYVWGRNNGFVGFF